ncbi:MAG: AAA family ATPase [bacterium]
MNQTEHKSMVNGGGPSPERHRNRDAYNRVEVKENPEPDRGDTAVATTSDMLAPDVVRTNSMRYRTAEGKIWEHFGIDEGETLSGQEYTNIMEGRRPDGSETELRARSDDVAYRDLVFSAPKSVSMAIYDTSLPDELRQGILEKSQQAQREVMQEIADELDANMGKGDTGPGEIGWMSYDDTNNTNGEPHLQHHSIVPNMAVTEDGRVKPIATDALQYRVKEFGQRFRNKLQHKLEHELGLECEPVVKGAETGQPKAGHFELSGYRPEDIQELSSRRNEILDKKEDGLGDFQAWLDNRNSNYEGEDMDPENVRERNEQFISQLEHSPGKTLAGAEWERWNQEQLQSDNARFSQLTNQSESEYFFETPDEASDREVSVDFAKERLTEQSNVLRKTDVIKEYMAERSRRGLPAIERNELDEHIEEAINDGQLIDLGDGKLTTPEQALRERKIMEQATASRNSPRFFSEEAIEELQNMTADEWEQEFDFPPSEAQKQLLTETISSNDRILAVAAQAGSGKTSTAEKLERFAQQDGVNTVGLAPSNKATAELAEKARMETQTVHSYIERHTGDSDVDRPSQLVVIDEASMVGTKDMHRLVSIAEEHDDQIMLVGDPDQLPAVGAGGNFRKILQEKGKESIRMDDNFRQQDDRLQEIVETGRDTPSEALSMLSVDEALAEIDDPAERIKGIAENYDRDTMVISGQNREVEALNDAIRQELKRRGELHPADRQVNVSGAYEREELGLQAGDTVQSTKTIHDCETVFGDEIKLNKNATMEVVNVTEEGDVNVEVNTPDGEAHTVPLRQEDFEDGIPLTYGYAGTVYKAQGQDAKSVVWNVSTENNLPRQQEFYTAISRAQEHVEVYTDDANVLCNQIEDEQTKSSTLAYEIDPDEYEHVQEYDLTQSIMHRYEQELVQEPEYEPREYKSSQDILFDQIDRDYQKGFKGPKLKEAEYGHLPDTYADEMAQDLYPDHPPLHRVQQPQIEIERFDGTLPRGQEFKSPEMEISHWEEPVPTPSEGLYKQIQESYDEAKEPEPTPEIGQQMEKMQEHVNQVDQLQEAWDQDRSLHQEATLEIRHSHIERGALDEHKREIKKELDEPIKQSYQSADRNTCYHQTESGDWYRTHEMAGLGIAHTKESMKKIDRRETKYAQKHDYELTNYQEEQAHEIGQQKEQSHEQGYERGYGY